MTAKEYLRQVGIMDRKINLDLRRLEELRNLSMRISGGGFEQSFNPNKATEAPFVKSMDRIIDLERKITEEIDAYVDFKETALGMIRKVPDFDQRELLEMRYVGQMSWEEISARSGRSLRSVYRVHGMALLSFASVLAADAEKNSELGSQWQ